MANEGGGTAGLDSVRVATCTWPSDVRGLCDIHAPTNDSEEEAKDQFYEQLERAYSAYPKNDVKFVMGDAKFIKSEGKPRISNLLFLKNHSNSTKSDFNIM
jgi:hypothetical protein